VLVRSSQPSGDRARRRWRNANEQYGRAHTVQKYWKRWADPRLVVCVFINQVLTKSLGNSVMEGNPQFNASQDIPDFAYAKFGEMLGFRSIYVDSPDRLASAWQESLASDRPVVIEVKTDPEIVPLPRI
jgi:pyruvate dehydrogenase (quinone)